MSERYSIAVAGWEHSHIVIDPPDIGETTALCGVVLPAGMSLWPPEEATCPDCISKASDAT